MNWRKEGKCEIGMGEGLEKGKVGMKYGYDKNWRRKGEYKIGMIMK